MLEQETFVTVEEVARRLSLNSETIRRWLRSGRLRGIRLGERRAGWRIREADLSAFLNERANVQKETEE
jgi:excisionase family DNA binding protein